MRMNLRYVSVVLLLFVGIGGVGPAWAGEKKQSYIVVERVIDHPFAHVVSRIEAGVKKNNLMIIGEPNYKQMQRMVGRNIRDAKAYFIFRPDLGTPIFEADYAAALEVPLKVLIFDQGGGKTAVRYAKPSSAFANYGDDLDSVGEKLDGILEEIVEGAAK